VPGPFINLMPSPPPHTPTTHPHPQSIGMEEFLEVKYVCVGLGYESDDD
jgi:hypothetical protein